MGLGYCPKTTSGSNICTHDDSAGISYKLSYRQQTKAQILTLYQAQKVNILVLFTLKIFQKNENVRKMSQQQQQQL